MRLPLAGFRVIDSTEERGELCARLLADLGADVVKVEPPGGASSRRLPPFAPDGTSLWFALRNTNKRSVTIDLAADDGRAELDRLLATSDVWVESSRPEPADDILVRHPHLVLTTITDFGLTGPYRDYVATDDVMVAMGGMLCRSGVLGRPPLLPPGSLAADVSSTMATFATLAALWQRRTTGRGQHLDVSVMQAVAQITDWSMANYTQIKAGGGTYGQLRNGSGPVYPLYPCADGYVRLIILSPRQWRSMRAWLGEPEVLQDDHWDSLLARMSIQADLLDPLFVELFKDRTAAELADEAQRRGIVMTPVLTPSRCAARAHFVERKTFVDAEVAPGGVRARGSRASSRSTAHRVGYRRRSPGGRRAHRRARRRGAAPRHAEAGPARPAMAAGALPALPFAGLKVLDFGHRRRRRGDRPAVRRVRRRRHQGRDAHLPRLHPQVSGGHDEPVVRFVQSRQAQPRRQRQGCRAASPCSSASSSGPTSLIENTSTGHDGRHGLALRRAPRRQPRPRDGEQPADGLDRAVEGLDRLRAEHPAGRRHDVPVELRRRRHPARVGRHPPRPPRRADGRHRCAGRVARRRARGGRPRRGRPGRDASSTSSATCSWPRPSRPVPCARSATVPSGARRGGCTSAPARSGGASSRCATTTTGSGCARRSAIPNGRSRRSSTRSRDAAATMASSTPASLSGRRLGATTRSWRRFRPSACRRV